MNIPNAPVVGGKFSIVGFIVFLALGLLAGVLLVVFTRQTVKLYDKNGNEIGTGDVKTGFGLPKKTAEPKPAATTTTTTNTTQPTGTA